MKKYLLPSLMAVSVAAVCHVQAAAWDEPLRPSQSDFGGVGLLQTPTARMAQEGEFSLNYRDNDQYRFYSVSMAVFPWLEASVRYSDVRTRRYSSSASFSGDQTYKDKAFDFKLRLWQEDYWLPEVAAGTRDLAGTGLFDSEYLVASKAWGPLDFTLGIGWGYIGNGGNIKNPFCRYDDKFCRRRNASGSTTAVNGDELFKGPASIFGGMEYQTPWQPLRLKLEYEGNDYRDDYAGQLAQRSRINVGAIYRLSDWADINVGYQRGDTLTFGVTLHTNFNQLHTPHFDQAKPEWRPQPQAAILQHTVVASQLMALKYNAGFDAPNLQIKQRTLYVTGEQVKYRDTQEGVDRANLILINHLPADIDTLRVTQTRYNLPQVTTETQVSSLYQQLDGYPLGHEQPLQQRRIDPVETGKTEQGYYIEKDRFSYGLAPVLNQSFGGPESFYMYQAGIGGHADYWLSRQLLVGGGFFADVTNNYDRFKYDGRPADSALPRVRTHIRDYVKNDFYLNNLQMNGFRYLGNGIYAQLYGGYLETMYGGAGAEVLYRPLDSRWAVGLDANYVKQRDWDNMMRFTRYRASTGHLTVYWQPGFMDDVLVKMSVGQYLAQDKGGTLDISKRFASGVSVGAYVTLTNVSREEYGEGDFTKGFYISVPMELFTATHNRGKARIGWEPLTRDGGQMLMRKHRLYDMTSDRDINFR